MPSSDEHVPALPSDYRAAPEWRLVADATRSKIRDG